MLLENLRQNYSTLSKSHQRLADYLADNYRQVAFMTSSQLAQEVHVNGATVTRFAQRLGYLGYPELTADLRSLVQRELAPESSVEASQQPAIGLALRNIADNLGRTSLQLDALAAQQAQELLAGASRIIVLAQGSAVHPASLLTALLQIHGQKVCIPSGDPYALAAAVAEASPGMLVIGLAFLGESQEVAAALRYANQQNIDTLAIASSPTNSVVQAARLALSWLADESNPALTIIQAVNILAALVQGARFRDINHDIEQRNIGALDAVLARRRRIN
ncbi:MAG: MurR/RpiR family transcriptional regulator [Chloroflexi bacterium]|nr:MurR/RpiR family transcriptional regulator [Chloroflexota bacterium]